MTRAVLSQLDLSPELCETFHFNLPALLNIFLETSVQALASRGPARVGIRRGFQPFAGRLRQRSDRVTAWFISISFAHR